MTLEAQMVRESCDVQWNASEALVSGQVIQQPDGRVSVVNSQEPVAVGTAVSGHLEDVYNFQTTGIVCLKGGCAWFVRATNKITSVKALGDFFVGTFMEDAASAATAVKVAINQRPSYKIDLNEGSWTSVSVGSATATRLAGGSVHKLAVIATAEAEKTDLMSDISVGRADGPILEAEVATFDTGTSVMDISFGLANGTNATDADAITEHVFFHFDGTLDVKAQSKDGTTTVVATDTTVDAVDDTYAEFWIDCRNPADIQMYVNGVAVLPATVFRLDNAVGPLKALIHIEKTSSAETGDLRVRRCQVRSTDLGLAD